MQARKRQVSEKPQVHGKGTNILTGIISCPQCSAPMAASNTTNTLKDGTKNVFVTIRVVIFEIKAQRYVLRIVLEPMSLKNMLWTKYLKLSK